MNSPPTPAASRASAAALVSQTIDRGRSLDQLLADDPFQGSARGLRRSLCYGTLRWHFRLAEILRRLSGRPPERLAPELRALIELGLFQLLAGEVAAHAAVAETVEAARELGFARATGYVNAVLRRFQRERDTVLAAVDVELAVRTAHPRWFVEALQREQPQACEAILDANNEHPPMWLRVNRMRSDPDRYAAQLEAMDLAARRHPWAADAILVEPAVDAFSLPGFAAGHVSVQDAAAQLAVDALAPRPGERILDACAAPGGKTCHILERVAGEAEVTAVDVAESRMKRVRDNLDRLGLSATLRVGDVSRPEMWWDRRPFDRVLLDVPCSATGVIRRHPDIKILRRGDDIPALASRQAAMLRSAWAFLRPGGTLVYTSCSVLRAENQEVIATFLTDTPAAEDGTAAACREWPERPPGTGPGYAVNPGEAGMDGFYYACLRKQA
jgi:16S rRNA (cytosine967-C5)-methyltransferase